MWRFFAFQSFYLRKKLFSSIIVYCERTSLTPCRVLGSLDQKEEHING